MNAIESAVGHSAQKTSDSASTPQNDPVLLDEAALVNDLNLKSDAAATDEGIVSVNAKGAPAQGNKAAKAIFLVVSGALVVGGMVFMGQQWATATKQRLRSNPKTPGAEAPDLFNPEGSKLSGQVIKVGAASGKPPPAPPVDRAPGVVNADLDAVRPVRGKDGKILLTPEGKAMGVSREGQLVEVPAIALSTGSTPPASITGSTPDKKMLPGQTVSSGAIAPGSVTAGSVTAGSGTQQGAQTAPPPSRYGGSLFVVGTNAPSAPSLAQATPAAAGSAPKNVEQQQKDLLSSISGLMPSSAKGGAPAGVGAPGAAGLFGIGGAPAGIPGGFGAPAAPNAAGSVGSQLSSSSTPVAFAGRVRDQNMMLPKGRQADCILTTRIIDELPGFTSCVLPQNLYSDDGRVLLLERGSEVSGEYGISGQTGSNRLFVTWNRIKTPGGITIDFNSPGSDRLGGSGVPGFLDKRWGERIGAAFMLSIFKDALSIAIQRNYPPPPPSTGGVSIDTRPTNTLKTFDSVADAILSEGMKARPTLSINEGERISIYIARDLDFSTVYQLRAAGSSGVVKVN